jgi:hypothetical protein
MSRDFEKKCQKNSENARNFKFPEFVRNFIFHFTFSFVSLRTTSMQRMHSPWLVGAECPRQPYSHPAVNSERIKRAKCSHTDDTWPQKATMNCFTLPQTLSVQVGRLPNSSRQLSFLFMRTRMWVRKNKRRCTHFRASSANGCLQFEQPVKRCAKEPKIRAANFQCLNEHLLAVSRSQTRR